MQITLEIQDVAAFNQLLDYVRSLSEVKIISTDSPANNHRKKLSARALKAHRDIIMSGGDASYFGDAAEWQRTERAERNLPF